MEYNHSSAHGVEATFEGREVETVRAAFRENAERLRSLGNDSSISKYEEWVARWNGRRQTYRAPKHTQLTEPLRYFVEATEDRVDELLDICPPAARITSAAKRYELGYNAHVILEEIEQRHSGEAVGSVD